jgi:hypothetical protein
MQDRQDQQAVQHFEHYLISNTNASSTVENVFDLINKYDTDEGQSQHEHLSNLFVHLQLIATNPDLYPIIDAKNHLLSHAVSDLSIEGEVKSAKDSDNGKVSSTESIMRWLRPKRVVLPLLALVLIVIIMLVLRSN